MQAHLPIPHRVEVCLLERRTALCRAQEALLYQKVRADVVELRLNERLFHRNVFDGFSDRDKRIKMSPVPPPASTIRIALL